MNIEDYYVTLEPEGTTIVFDGYEVNLVCSTNLPATYARWEINGQKYSDSVPPGFIANEFNIDFTFEETVQIRCFIRIFIDGSLADVCSNTATITTALENEPLQSNG